MLAGAASSKPSQHAPGGGHALKLRFSTPVHGKCQRTVFDSDEIIERLRQQVILDKIRVSLHGHEEMVEEDVSYDQLCEALLDGKVIENYPEYQRGPCCLVCGQTTLGRYLHVVCTTSLEVAIIITVYEPKLPKWITPFQRREKL